MTDGPDESSVPERDGIPERAEHDVPAADQARERLQAVQDAPLEEHVEIFEDVHRQLQEGLADLDEG